jgi:hypothetical protein
MKRLSLLLPLVLAACQASITTFPLDAGQTVVCDTGTIQCGTQCVNSLLDNANCGVCGRACANGQSCGGGTCYSNTCADFSCAAGQVCPGGQTCVDRTCVGVTCGTAEICVTGKCQSTLCNGVACATGLACVSGTCTDLNCQGVTCPAGKTCKLGGCVGAGAGAALQEFSSGGSFGELQQSNDTHVNRAVLGEPTPPVDGVTQSNATHTNRGGFVTALQKP